MTYINLKQSAKELLPTGAIILFASLLRLLPHIPNVAPIAAMALFGGIYLHKKYALVVPLIALFLSDIFLGFYKGMPFVYGSFVLIGLCGMLLKRYKYKRLSLVFGSFFGSVLFFLITNFGVYAKRGLCCIGIVRHSLIVDPFKLN